MKPCAAAGIVAATTVAATIRTAELRGQAYWLHEPRTKAEEKDPVDA